MSLSAKGRRDKGVAGEREVRQRFELGGFEVRGLEGEGDHLVICEGGLTLHVESKRQETLRLPLWSQQAEAEAPQGTLPLVAYRRSREPWRVSLRLDDFIALLVTEKGAPVVDAMNRELSLLRLLVEHHAVGALDGLHIGDQCPLCAASSAVETVEMRA